MSYVYIKVLVIIGCVIKGMSEDFCLFSLQVFLL